MSSFPVRSPSLSPQEGNSTVFKTGHPKFGGRQKGSPNRLGGDLRQMIMDAAVETGYLETIKGKRIATGREGCKGFLKWLYVNEPRVGAELVKIRRWGSADRAA